MRDGKEQFLWQKCDTCRRKRLRDKNIKNASVKRLEVGDIKLNSTN